MNTIKRTIDATELLLVFPATLFHVAAASYMASFVVTTSDFDPDRVIAPEVGGGFGSRIPHYPEDSMAIFAAKMLNRPVRAKAAEELLTGQAPTPENIAGAATAVSEALENPFGDTYASGEFRVHLATVMTKRALTGLLP